MKRSHIFFAVFLLGCLAFIGSSRTAHASTLPTQQPFLYNLRLGAMDSDVARLQKYLNEHGALVATSGPGSLGNETQYYGPATARAMRLFQEKHAGAILFPLGLTKGTGNFYTATRNFVNQTLGQDPISETVSKTSGYYTIGGTLTGITGQIILRNNTDTITINPGQSATFRFPTKLASGQSYNLAVTQMPNGQHCFIAPGQNSNGVVYNSDVNIPIQCSSNGLNPFKPLIPSSGIATYTIGGTVSGLTDTVILEKSNGDSLTISNNGAFAFPTAIASGGSYSVSITSQPAGQTCNIVNDNGTNISANITNIDVSCVTNTFTVGGTVSGLSGTVILLNNGGDANTLTSDGPFTFATPVAEGSPYSVAVQTQPADQTCVITNSTGIMGGSNVTNVSVSCSLTLVSITVTPSNSSLPRTITKQFTAIGQYADSSTADITASVAWDTSNHSIATINGTGLGTGVSSGTTQVSATLDGVVGNTNLTVTNATLVAITVLPNSSTLPTGINLQYTAQGIFSDASTVNITNQATWEVSDPTIATIDGTRLVTGVSPGITQIRASLNAVLGSTNLTVTDAILVSITISPSNPSVARNSTLQLSAIGTFSDSSAVNITNQAAWTSTATSVATVNNTDHKGKVTGVAGGASSIRASLTFIMGTATLFVGS